GIKGVDGKSAYELWIEAGNTGTEAEFLTSLQGETGATGPQGIQGETGATGTKGVDGKSAYELWIEAGNTGTEAEFLTSLQGEKGATGWTGPTGPAGPMGPQGPAGATGQDGVGGVTEVVNTGILSLTGTGTVADPYIIDATETDPTFTAWDKSSGISITESQIIDLDHFTNTDETDPVYSISQAAYITNAGSGAVITDVERTKLAGIAADAEVNVNADWNATSGDAQILNKPTIPAAANGSETKLKAGTNVTITGSGTTGSPYVVSAFVSMTQGERDALATSEGMVVYNTTTHKPNYYNGTEWKNYDGTSAKTLAKGVNYQGGVIIYILQSGDPGYVNGETHGLIAATSAQSNSAWWNGSYVVTGATAKTLGTGSANTALIISAQGNTGNYAAKVCADYSVTVDGVTYDDWYLPSHDELYKLYAASSVVPNFSYSYYWSSSEVDSNYAWWLNTYPTYLEVVDKKGTYAVRAIRSF
ncbi:MAG: collagen-like protein, partial [Prolixibacteraceae bacterium]|nr:collagen-like protein [Prolixibacteraceae bacterium]